MMISAPRLRRASFPDGLVAVRRSIWQTAVPNCGARGLPKAVKLEAYLAE